jgi:hypothetical protein
LIENIKMGNKNIKQNMQATDNKETYKTIGYKLSRKKLSECLIPFGGP